MYLRQKGLLPEATSLVGFLIFAYGFFAAIFNIYHGLIGSSGGSAEDYNGTIRLLVLVGFAFLGFAPFMLVGLGLAGLFPEIRITNRGVHYRYFYLVTGSILWDEVDELIELRQPRGCLALAVSREGIGLFKSNGFIFNFFYGFIIGHQHPILLLHPTLEEGEGVIEEIRQRIQERK